MPLEIQAHTAFLSSPGDVAPERGIFARVISEINRIYLTATNSIIWPIMWEDMIGGMGSDAQDVINRQTPDFDIFAGIVWSRFGSPTQRAGSGTEEEFENALRLHRDTGGRVDFMIFVKSADFPQNVDPGQIQKLRDFVGRLRSSGILYHKFKDEREFEALARRHMLAYLATKSPRLPQAKSLGPGSLRNPIKQDERPARQILTVVSRFSNQLAEIVTLLSTRSRSKRDAGRRMFRSATIDLLSEGGACVQRVADWTYLYGRTCYSELVDLGEPHEREKLVMEMEGVCAQVVEWRQLLSKAPLIDAEIASEFATAREFMDYCVCALQTSIHGLAGPRHAH